MKKSIFILFVYSALLTLSEYVYRILFHIPQLNISQIIETFALISAFAAAYLYRSLPH